MADLVCQDLATKAEVQELRDQLNEVLGTKEDGSRVDMFVKDQGNNLIGGAIGLTLLGMAKTNAPKVITDLLINAQGQGILREQLANGTAKVKAFNFATGTQRTVESMTPVTKTVGQNSAAAGLAAKGASTAAASLAVLASLVNIAVTLGLNIATTKVLGNRIDAVERGTKLQLDTINNGMLRLYEKNQGDIARINVEIEENNQRIAENQQANANVQTEVREAYRANRELNSKIDEANTAIANLQTQNNELVDQINNSTIEAQEVINSLTATTQEIQSNLEKALVIIDEQRQTITAHETRIVELEQRQEELELEHQSLSLSFIHLREDFWRLRQDLGLEEPTSLLSEDSIVARTIIFTEQQTAAVSSGGGSSAAAIDASVSQQNKLLTLTKNLSSSEIEVPTITDTDVRNRTATFTSTFDALIQNFDTGTVNQQQLDDLRTSIISGTSADLSSLLASTVVPRLDDIQIQTNDERQKTNIKAGICESLNGGSCPITPTNPNPVQGLQGMNQGLNNKADAINAALGTANLQANQSILGIVKNTNEAVRSSQYGLEKIQSYASTAWQAVQGDKIMNGITTALVVHNAIMLSGNLAQTVGEAASVTLSAIGIKDEEGNPFDIGSIVQTKTQEILTNFLGQENYQALTRRIAAASRVYQASANILDTTHALFDSARTVAEITASNTGKIGNALKESGAVYEDAYGEMLENMSPQNAAMRRLDRFREGLESIEDGVSTVSNVSSEVLEIRENYQQLKEEKENWQTETTLLLEEQATTRQEARDAVQVTTDVSEADFDPAIPE